MLDRAPMTSGRQWRLKHWRQATDAAATRALRHGTGTFYYKHGVPRRPETIEVLMMRKLIATVFNYSLDGLLADEGTEFWTFCFDLPENREPDDPAQLDCLRARRRTLGCGDTRSRP